jgi:predicted RNase H-like HicB family nuclease
VSQGKTEEDPEENIRDAIKERLEVRAEKGLPLTVTTLEVEPTPHPSPSADGLVKAPVS